MSLLKFALDMERKLIENDHKTGWKQLSPQWIINRIRQETQELETALKNEKSIKEIQLECADISNFAFMLWDNLEDEREDEEGE